MTSSKHLTLTFKDEFGHLAILSQDSKTVLYYYHEWRQFKPLTPEGQGRPVLSRKFDFPLEAVKELNRLGYKQLSEDESAWLSGELVDLS